MAKAWWRDSDYELFDRLTKERDEARTEVERLTRANTTLNAMLDGKMPDTWREDIESMQSQRDEALDQVERLTRERDDAFLKCKAWMKDDAEQARAYGLTYEGIRKMVHDYLDDEISFGKLVELIRGAAKAMAEDAGKETP